MEMIGGPIRGTSGTSGGHTEEEMSALQEELVAEKEQLRHDIGTFVAEVERLKTEQCFYFGFPK